MKSVTSDFLYIPADLERLPFTVTRISAISTVKTHQVLSVKFTSLAGDGANRETPLNFENGENTLDILSFTAALRVWVDTSTIKGQPGRLTFTLTHTAENPSGPVVFSTVLIDDIGIGGGLAIADTSGARDDRIVFFDNAKTGLLDEDQFGTGLEAIARDTPGVFRQGHSQQEITISNTSRQSTTFRISGPASAWLSLHETGNAGNVGAALDLAEGQSFTLAPGATQSFALRAGFLLEDLRALAGSQIVNTTITLSELDSNGAPIDSQTISLNYLLDISDDSTTDGVLTLPRVNEGAPFVFTMAGSNTFDAALKNARQQTGLVNSSVALGQFSASSWFTLKGETAGAGNFGVAFAPSGISGVIPARAASAEITLGVGGAEVYTINVSATGQRGQKVNYDLSELDRVIADLHRTLGSDAFTGSALVGDSFRDDILGIYSPLLTTFPRPPVESTEGLDRLRRDTLERAVYAGFGSVLDILDLGRGAKLSTNNQDETIIGYTNDPLTLAELIDYQDWRDAGAVTGFSPASTARGRLDADRNTFGGLTTPEERFSLRPDLSDAQILHRLGQAVNQKIAEGRGVISISVDAMIRALAYDVERGALRPDGSPWENTLSHLGERIGWTIAHEYLHTLGLMDEYDLDGVPFEPENETVMSVPFSGTLSKKQRMIIALALGAPLEQPGPEEARALAEWYLDLAMQRFRIGDGDFVNAPGGTVIGSGPFSNGDFMIEDLLAPGFGWHLDGPATLAEGVLRLVEGVPIDGSAQQDFALPANVSALVITFRPNLAVNDAFGPDDAFEIALRAQSDGGTTAVGPIALLRGDAAFNLQADGTIYQGAGVSVAGLGQDGRVQAGATLTVRIDLTAISEGTPLRLYLDLIGSGMLASGVDILAVSLLEGDSAPNRSPVAVDDSASVVRGGVVVVDVLANDSDPDNDALTVSILTGPDHGSAEVLPDGRIRYVSSGAYTGLDSLTYRISDGRGGIADAQLVLNVLEPEAPLGLVDPGPLTLSEGEIINRQLFATGAGADAASFSLLAPVEGVTLTADGLLRVEGLDGPARFVLQIEARAEGGELAPLAIEVSVENVPPQGAAVLTGPAFAALETEITFSATDPGRDTISEWVIDWGDGTQALLPGDATSARHIYATGGTRDIVVQARDEDGLHQIDTLLVDVAPETLKIIAIDARLGGIEIGFNLPFLPAQVDLYGTGPHVPDVIITRVSDGSDVRGSLILMDRGLIFLPTEVMVAGAYDIRVRSAADALRIATGLLDGDGDGIGGDDFVQRVTIPAILPLARLGDALAPGGGIFRDASGEPGLALGVVSDGGMREIVFELEFDPAMVEISGFAPAPGLVLEHFDLTRDETGPRHKLTITLRLAAALPAQEVTLGRLMGASIAGLDYGATGLLSLTVREVNGELLNDGVFHALHLAAMPGDIDGDGTVGPADALLRAAVEDERDTGFAAFPRIDPARLIADFDPETDPTKPEPEEEEEEEEEDTPTPTPPDPTPTPTPEPARPGTGGGGGASGGGGAFSGVPRAISGGAGAPQGGSGVGVSTARIDIAQINLAACTFTDADLTPELRALLNDLTGQGADGAGWCVMTSEEFAAQTAQEMLPLAPDAPRADDLPYWCGGEIAEEIRTLLSQLAASFGLETSPGGWCIISLGDGSTLALTPGENSAQTAILDTERVGADLLDGADFALFAAFGAAAVSHPSGSRGGTGHDQKRKRKLWASDEVMEVL
ncbi:MAG TPA: cadherin-like domain-containing protein [Paracoccus sp.]|nr:cadherin-like domain-containing protein [Paracoccus sp. (in: a-proteobacteria)]